MEFIKSIEFTNPLVLFGFALLLVAVTGVEITASSGLGIEGRLLKPIKIEKPKARILVGLLGLLLIAKGPQLVEIEPTTIEEIVCELEGKWMLVSNDPSLGFNQLLEVNEKVRDRLGSTIWPFPITEMGAYQEFENGQMFFRASNHPEFSIYVMYPDGDYRTHNNVWRHGDELLPGPLEKEPPTGFYEPISGFGHVWYENNDIRQDFSYATMCEISVKLQVQTFTDGFLVRFEDFDHFSNDDKSTCVFPTEHIGKTFAFFYSPRTAANTGG